MPSLGLVANVYNEVNALPGWLETHLPFFDDVRVLHAGPGGNYSEDGTLELLERWQIPVKFSSIDLGFGAVRSEAIRYSPCDYVMILDADERFYPIHNILTCEGESTTRAEVDSILQSYDFRDLENVPINWENLSRLGKQLRVNVGGVVNQGDRLREIIAKEHPDAIAAIRRHWHGVGFRHPTQNWHTEADRQLRIVKNDGKVCFDSATKMHEQIQGAGRVFHADMSRGPFFDHFHFFFKKMEQHQRAHDIAIYDAIWQGRRPPSWEEFKSNDSGD